MSADNWTTCPSCWHDAQVVAIAEKARVMALYGTLPVEEFDAQREALVEPDPDNFSTFREDYEFYGADEGEVTGSYRGSCTVCKLSVELRASERFWSPPS